MDEEYQISFTNVIKMDDENIKKFKKLYGEGQQFSICGSTSLCPDASHCPSASIYETRLSFSQIIPEVQKNESDKEWFDNSLQDAGFVIVDKESKQIGKSLAKWRVDHWGTSSDLLYFVESFSCGDKRSLQTPEGLLKGEYQFFTMCRPPIKIYEKMAADGLVFETKWWSQDYGSRAYDEWAIGKGQVVEGQFQYHIGPMTGRQEMSMEAVLDKFFWTEESLDDRPTIVAKNREHLDQLIQHVQERFKHELHMQGTFCHIREISENTIILNKVLDLNFIDVSNVPDLSNLFANFDISPCPEKGWFCKIELDISKWNIPNATKETLLHDNKRVDLVNLSK